MATKKDHVVGGSNVFADLGYARPEEAAAKAELATRSRRSSSDEDSRRLRPPTFWKSTSRRFGSQRVAS